MATVDAMPRWNIDDLIDSDLGDARNSDGFWLPDFARIDQQIETFHDRTRGHLAELDGDGLASAIRAYENISEILGRIGSYASLLHAENREDKSRGQHFQYLLEALTNAGQKLVFFTLELNSLPEDTLASLTEQSPTLTHYAPWLGVLRVAKPYELPEREERLLAQKTLTSNEAWVRLFDETMAGMRFDVRDQRYTQAELLKLLTEKDRSLRKDAAEAFTDELARHQDILCTITNVLAKDKSIEDNWRGFARPISSRNLSNLTEDTVVDALTSAVKAAYPRLSHRYYALKATLLDLPKLKHYDRLCHLPQQDDTPVSWNEARALVLDAYHSFSPKIGTIAEKFFREGWIDAPVRPGKDSGAFAHPTVPSAHPYILLNYQGKGRDVMTLAHELGHGIHQTLAANQGLLKSQTPLTLAETASVFGEMLTFERLLAQCPSENAKIALLGNKIEDMLATVVRQISFLDYEVHVHDARSQGELSSQQLGEIWMQTSRDSLGPALDLDPEYAVMWGYIPHFIHSPFYVYAYAFGDCLVNALYQSYKDDSLDPDRFVGLYTDLLAAGGSKRYDELLKPFGLDPKDPAFWGIGLRVIEEKIDQLEALVAHAGSTPR